MVNPSLISISLKQDPEFTCRSDSGVVWYKKPFKSQATRLAKLGEVITLKDQPDKIYGEIICYGTYAATKKPFYAFAKLRVYGKQINIRHLRAFLCLSESNCIL